jgi:hypothetical protein
MTRLPRKRVVVDSTVADRREWLKVALDLVNSKATGSHRKWLKHSRKPLSRVMRLEPKLSGEENAAAIGLRLALLVDALSFTACQIAKQLEERAGVKLDEAQLLVWGALEEEIARWQGGDRTLL